MNGVASYLQCHAIIVPLLICYRRRTPLETEVLYLAVSDGVCNMREEILQRIAMLPIMHINFGIDPPHFVENKLISVFVDMQHLILFSSLRVAEPYKTYQLFNLRSYAKICFVRSA